MSRWRILVASSLVVIPFVVLACLGSYFLWIHGWTLLAWWPMVACMLLGYSLALYWHRRKQLLQPADEPPLYWTDRDREAWRLVQARAEQGVKAGPDKLTEFQYYVQTAQDLAQELAHFYYPRAMDPISSVTIPELLAVIELASQDLAEMVDNYLPGGHLLTINHWRNARKLADWYQTASNIYWVASALFSPINTGLRFLSSKVALTRPLQMLQEDLVAWFFMAYVHRLGTYLIELNSGRLRVGARRYRELQRALIQTQETIAAPGVPETGEQKTEDRGQKTEDRGQVEAADQVRQVALTIMGQVKAGKSSLINALLGEQRAKTDVLPTTAEVTRYELRPEGVPTRLVLFDTVGYGHAGPRADQLRATEESARQSDLLLLVLHARNPARQADLELLQKLRAWFASQPELKMPPVLGVLTHIDLLSPAMEWAPPYDWVDPHRPKEQQIHAAWDALREQLGEYLVGIVPVCLAPGRIYGLEEWFLPTLSELLDEAHAVAFLRCLRAEANLRKVRKVFHQLVGAGKQAAKVLWRHRTGERMKDEG